MAVRRVMLFAGIVGMLVTAGAPLAAQAPEMIHACVSSPRGNVRIVAPGEACVPSERTMQWPATAPAGGGGSVRVLDAAGLTVGWLLSAGPIFPNVLIQAGDDWVGAGVAATGFTFSFGEPQFYYSTPCPADGSLHGFIGHFAAFPQPLLARTGAALKSAPRVLYYEGETDPGFVPRSVETSGFNSGRTCHSVTSVSPTGKYAFPRSIDVSVFQAPFRISQ